MDAPEAYHHEYIDQHTHDPSFNPVPIPVETADPALLMGAPPHSPPRSASPQPHLTATATTLPSANPKGKPKPKPVGERAPGQSLLPMSRVQKIMKADKELAGTAKEAVFLISIATEEFIKRMAQEGYAQASREGRSTIMLKDMANAVKQADELLFLQDIIPHTVPLSTAMAKAEQKAAKGVIGDDPETGAIQKAFERSKNLKKGKGKADPSVEYGNGLGGSVGGSGAEGYHGGGNGGLAPGGYAFSTFDQQQQQQHPHQQLHQPPPPLAPAHPPSQYGDYDMDMDTS